jgi:tRNA A-37 threonylcarbamoyl transferase component Bud32
LSALVGKTLKDYYVLRRLGQGAMAEVYLAQQMTLGRQVALKVLNAELARDPVYVERFQQEARSAAALVHAGIVQIYEVGQGDVGEGKFAHYIAQEYVPGRNLGEVIHSRGRLEPALALDILRQVAAALAKAASEGIVHRDIKPENIMLARSGDVKVADFGLARVQGDGGANLTQIGVTMGTPLYMSPEQIEGRALDSRSDIYSLGVTAYHMLSGNPPHTGDTPLAVAMQHLNQRPEQLEKIRPDVPRELAVVVHRMLEKKPDDRFADPAELLRELHGLAKSGAVQGWATAPQDWSLAELIAVADDRAMATARLGEVMKTSALATTRRKSSQRGWLAAAVAACIALGVAAGVLSRPPSLLAGATSGPPPQSSVWAQLYQAKRANTEAAWRAVDTHFPNADRFPKALATQGLASYFLFRSQEWDKALGPLHELAGLSDSDQEFKAFGIAGLVVAEYELGHYEDARNQYSLLDSSMRTLVEERSPQLYDALEATLVKLDQQGR